MSDIDEIRQLLSRWMHLDDGGQDDKWVDEIVTEDFAFHVGGKTLTGRDTMRELNKTRQEDPTPRGRHILSEPVVEFTGDGRAVAHTNYVYVTAAGSGYQISTAGQYRDELVTDDSDRWRVSGRTNTHLALQP